MNSMSSSWLRPDSLVSTEFGPALRHAEHVPTQDMESLSTAGAIMDHAKALATVASNGRSLANVGEHRSSEAVCLAAVQNWGLALEHAADEMKRNETVVRAACKHDG